ncbi:hypothetical protein ACRAWG_30665 [Methylobacterium sp. P31]
MNEHRFQPGSSMLAWLFTILREPFHFEMRRRWCETEDAEDIHAEPITAAWQLSARSRRPDGSST